MRLKDHTTLQPLIYRVSLLLQPHAQITLPRKERNSKLHSYMPSYYVAMVTSYGLTITVNCLAHESYPLCVQLGEFEDQFGLWKRLPVSPQPLPFRFLRSHSVHSHSPPPPLTFTSPSNSPGLSLVKCLHFLTFSSYRCPLWPCSGHTSTMIEYSGALTLTDSLELWKKKNAQKNIRNIFTYRKSIIIEINSEVNRYRKVLRP